MKKSEKKTKKVVKTAKAKSAKKTIASPVKVKTTKKNVVKKPLTSGTNKSKWTKEKCLAEAKKYQTRNKWQRNSPGSYHAVRNNGWSMDEYTKHMKILRSGKPKKEKGIPQDYQKVNFSKNKTKIKEKLVEINNRMNNNVDIYSSEWFKNDYKKLAYQSTLDQGKQFLSLLSKELTKPKNKKEINVIKKVISDVKKDLEYLKSIKGFDNIPFIH